MLSLSKCIEAKGIEAGPSILFAYRQKTQGPMCKNSSKTNQRRPSEFEKAAAISN
jgi:hypothetical protein